MRTSLCITLACLLLMITDISPNTQVPPRNSTLYNILEDNNRTTESSNPSELPYPRPSSFNWCWYPCHCWYDYEAPFTGSYPKCWCWYPCGCWYNLPYLRGGIDVNESEPNLAIALAESPRADQPRTPPRPIGRPPNYPPL
jgi:hypothetical protein